METIGKFVRGACSIPFIGGFIALIIGILPFFLLIPFWNDSNKFLLGALGGILVAVWCFFLSKKQIINIVAPVIPVPFWGFGLAIAAVGVYQHVFGPL